jgi:hypothetical protein
VLATGQAVAMPQLAGNQAGSPLVADGRVIVGSSAGLQAFTVDGN